MFIDNINLNHIRIFESVYRTKSMTKAAEELHMTQSGVSQHIKILEDILEVKLFDRIKQRLIPTGQATELYEQTSKGLYQIEEALSSVKQDKRKLSGLVSVGMPIEFGNNMILPLIAEFGIKHPELKFNIKYDYANTINEQLLRGDLDFGFVDDFRMDKVIDLEKIYDEELILCVTRNFMQNYPNFVETKKNFEKLFYIDYVKQMPLLMQWFKFHFNVHSIKLNVKATLMDVQGVGRLIAHDFAVGILPGHHLRKLERIGFSLHKFQGNGNVLKNTISLAQLKDRRTNPAVRELIKYIKLKLVVHDN